MHLAMIFCHAEVTSVQRSIRCLIGFPGVSGGMKNRNMGTRFLLHICIFNGGLSKAQ